VVLFVPGGWDVAASAAQLLVAAPVDPLEDGHFDVGRAFQRARKRINSVLNRPSWTRRRRGRRVAAGRDRDDSQPTMRPLSDARQTYCFKPPDVVDRLVSRAPTAPVSFTEVQFAS
jgi:hypothetical protein